MATLKICCNSGALILRQRDSLSVSAYSLKESIIIENTGSHCSNFSRTEILGTSRVYCALLLERVCSSVPQNDHTIQVALKVLATKHLVSKRMG